MCFLVLIPGILVHYCHKEIQALLDNHTSKSAIGRIFGVNRMTVDSFLKERMKK
jgi:hypothetical protein